MRLALVTVDGQPITGPLPWPRATAMARSFLRHWPQLRREQVGFIDAV